MRFDCSKYCDIELGNFWSNFWVTFQPYDLFGWKSSILFVEQVWTESYWLIVSTWQKMGRESLYFIRNFFVFTDIRRKCCFSRNWVCKLVGGFSGFLKAFNLFKVLSSGNSINFRSPAGVREFECSSLGRNEGVESLVIRLDCYCVGSNIFKILRLSDFS